jgi:hypothetical protein
MGKDKEKEKDVKPKEGHQRTEFIILFIWQEPTPSDALRGIDDTSGTGGAAGGAGGTGGSPPPAGQPSPPR